MFSAVPFLIRWMRKIEWTMTSPTMIGFIISRRSQKRKASFSTRKNEILGEIEQVLKKYKIKVIILIIIELILVLFFWYFVTAFCHVYKATQTSWLIDSCLSILARWIIELLISLGLAKLYILAITGESSCLYKFIMFLYNFG